MADADDGKEVFYQAQVVKSEFLKNDRIKFLVKISLATPATDITKRITQKGVDAWVYGIQGDSYLVDPRNSIKSSSLNLHNPTKLSTGGLLFIEVEFDGTKVVDKSELELEPELEPESKSLAPTNFLSKAWFSTNYLINLDNEKDYALLELLVTPKQNNRWIEKITNFLSLLKKQPHTYKNVYIKTDNHWLIHNLFHTYQFSLAAPDSEIVQDQIQKAVVNMWEYYDPEKIHEFNARVEFELGSYNFECPEQKDFILEKGYVNVDKLIGGNAFLQVPDTILQKNHEFGWTLTSFRDFKTPQKYDFMVALLMQAMGGAASTIGILAEEKGEGPDKVEGASVPKRVKKTKDAIAAAKSKPVKLKLMWAQLHKIVDRGEQDYVRRNTKAFTRLKVLKEREAFFIDILNKTKDKLIKIHDEEVVHSKEIESYVADFPPRLLKKEVFNFKEKLVMKNLKFPHEYSHRHHHHLLLLDL